MKSKEQIEKALRETKDHGEAESKSFERHIGFVEALEWVLADKKVDNWPFDDVKLKRWWPWFQE
jgi:hypothetical protein